MTQGTIDKFILYQKREGIDSQTLVQRANMDPSRWVYLNKKPYDISDEEIESLDSALDVAAGERGPIFSTWGDKVRFYRVRNGVKQVELAKYLGVSQAALCNWEKMGFRPRDRALIEKAERYVGILSSEEVCAFDSAPKAVTPGLESRVIGALLDPVRYDSASDVPREQHICSALYTLGFALEYYREASPAERLALAKVLSGPDVGYITAFLRSLVSSKQGGIDFAAINGPKIDYGSIFGGMKNVEKR